MSYIIVYTTNRYVEKRLASLSSGGGNPSSFSNLFVMNINGKVKVMKNNGMVLTFLSGLLNKYPNEIFVWVAERITLHEFPDECKKAGSWLSERPNRNLRHIPNGEELEKCKINFSVNSKG
jgi:hypothetical protein